MTSDSYRYPAEVRRPLHPMLLGFPAACFIGTMLTDIAYWATAQMIWANFSAWLLLAGLVTGGIVLVVGIVDAVRGRLSYSRGPIWIYVIGNLLVLGLSLLNAFVHSRDAWTSVVPTGIVLSIIVVLILLVTGWMSWTVEYGRREGALD